VETIEVASIRKERLFVLAGVEENVENATGNVLVYVETIELASRCDASVNLSSCAPTSIIIIIIIISSAAAAAALLSTSRMPVTLVYIRLSFDWRRRCARMRTAR